MTAVGIAALNIADLARRARERAPHCHTYGCVTAGCTAEVGAHEALGALAVLCESGKVVPVALARFARLAATAGGFTS